MTRHYIRLRHAKEMSKAAEALGNALIRVLRMLHNARLCDGGRIIHQSGPACRGIESRFLKHVIATPGAP